ncbi:MAG TPA: cyanophycinase [Chitinophagales bacterium]|nr:cyanophycinase [Chitinophagales bacterium]HNJ89687.1 cyanophycinase [Chitinophagales bacterium]HNK97154.1 cyanophycinase [Chitinophagales bacterium]
MKLLFNLTVVLTLACIMSCSDSTNTVEKVNIPAAKGKLFIIGGGDRGDSLMQAMLDAAGWEKGDLITAITLPSGWGDSAYIWLNNDFKKLTGQNCVKFDSAAVHVPAKLDSLRMSKVIFISGGDQNKMMQLIKGTDIKKAIKEAYMNGATISGTSAGASIQSEKMITGDGLIDTVYDVTFDVLWNGNIELVEGLGLLDSVIIDQHFVVRSRHNRLLSAVIENPGYQGVGIDEGTAILVSGDTATVYGASQVLTFTNPASIASPKDSLLNGRDIRVSIYLPGEKFAIKR